MTQAGLSWATGAAVFVAIVATAAEWRRSRRSDLDRVGLMPWGALSLLGFVGALVGVALLLR